MKTKKYQITQAEWPIMQVLWETDTATAAEIVNIVSSKSEISMRTVKTLIRRLVAKESVSYTIDKNDSRVYHYQAEVTEACCSSVKADVLLNTIFNRDATDMLLSFISNTKLSILEIEKLENLLEKKRDELKDDHR